MAEQEGYVKVDRNMLSWRWITRPSIAHLFLIMLLKANYKPLEFEGVMIQPGQLVTSWPSLAKNSGLSIQQCRTAVSKLKSTGEITVKVYPRFQVITIVNYSLYQELTGRLTVKQQASNRQLTGKQQQEKDKKTSKQENKKEIGRSAPGSPSGRNDAHLRLGPDEGTVDDIPDIYRDMFDNFADYWRWRNQ